MSVGSAASSRSVNEIGTGCAQNYARAPRPRGRGAESGVGGIEACRKLIKLARACRNSPIPKVFKHTPNNQWIQQCQSVTVGGDNESAALATKLFSGPNGFDEVHRAYIAHAISVAPACLMAWVGGDCLILHMVLLRLVVDGVGALAAAWCSP